MSYLSVTVTEYLDSTMIGNTRFIFDDITECVESTVSKKAW